MLRVLELTLRVLELTLRVLAEGAIGSTLKHPEAP
jgi:hypothetical protein